MTKVLTVNCPQCKKKFNYYDSEFRPFCCEKCKLIDLGLWLSESYGVPVPENKLTPEEQMALLQVKSLTDEDSEN
ncbi:MAG: DNA gyrase inhibitor YacG [Bacteriovoracaceae bacterium]|jgi:endogenous inhibitor of DNA gyrase (YacG/DUF329 family)